MVSPDPPDHTLGQGVSLTAVPEAGATGDTDFEVAFGGEKHSGFLAATG